jgi:osmotically inducible protein OsmC
MHLPLPSTRTRYNQSRKELLMPTRLATAVWEGDLVHGQGRVASDSKALNHPYNFSNRFENAPGTNPEELLGAAHAACFSMALSHMLALGGHAPTRVSTKAAVTIDKVGNGFKITRILLTCEAVVPGIDEKMFLDTANQAKTGCPVSQALAATSIELLATLVK